MKVLLAATNREHSPFPVAPIGALCVAAAGRAAGHDVEFLDLGFESSPVRALRRALRRGGFGAVAFSIRNLDNCSYFMARAYDGEVRELVEAARQAFGGPVILGGSGFSIAPRGWMRRLGADCGVIGEGERAFTELLARIDSRAPLEGIPGVLTAAQAADPAAPCSPAQPIPELDALAPPDHPRCRYARYLARGGFVSIQTKRGCPFGCIYCIYPQLEGRAYRLRSPERVVDEMEGVIQNSGSRHFFFVDSVFNDPRAHALALCEALARRRLPARWMAFCNPVGFDATMARAMVEAGCVGVEFGLDAATDKMLAALHKPFNQQEIETALRAAHAAGLPCAVHLLFGGPGESWRDVEETQRFLGDCAPVSGVFASFGFRVYEGTPLERLALHEGALPERRDLFEPFYYVSPEMDEEPAANLDRIVRRRPEWSSPVDWRKPVMRWTQALLNRLGVRPQWKNVSNYGKHMRR